MVAQRAGSPSAAEAVRTQLQAELDGGSSTGLAPFERDGELWLTQVWVCVRAVKPGDEVRAAAKRSGRGLSGWLADAATARLRAEALAEFLDAWESEHGEFTAEELAQAAVELRLPATPAAEAA